MTLVTTSSRTRLIDMTSSSGSPSAAPKRSASAPSRAISDRSLTKTSEMLDIEPAQHRRRRLVEQVGAPDVLETLVEIVGAQPLLFRTFEIVQHGAAVHHDE